MATDVTSLAHQQHRLFHDIYVLLDDGDRRVLEIAELTPLEFAVLQRMDEREGRRLTDIGAELLCVKSTITRLVDRLEGAGLVLRTPDPADRRAQRVVLTARGREVRVAALALHDDAVERRLGMLSPQEQRQLSALLEKLRIGLADDLAAQE